MNNTAVEDLFIREQKLPNAADAISGGTAKVVSGVRDWKRWGRDHSKDLGIAVWIEDSSGFTAGGIEITMKSGASESDLKAIETKTAAVADIDRNGRLAFFLLPRTGIKQYVQVEVKTVTQFKKGGVAADPVVSVGLENDAEQDIDMTMVQPKIG